MLHIAIGWPVSTYNLSPIKQNLTFHMSQFYSIVHEEKFYKIRYPTTEARSKKYLPPKTKNHEMRKSIHNSDNIQKTPYQFPVKNFDFLPEASKSEPFIHPPSRLSLSRLEKDRIILKKIYGGGREGAESEGKMEAELGGNCDKSLQQLMGSKPNSYKTQYSKIARRKETIIKRNLIIEDEKETKKGNGCEFSQQKLIQKYRELMQEDRPLNMINRLYQNDLLLAKLMPLSTKEKLIITKLSKNEKELEERISSIVSKPSQYDTIRKMLLNIHDVPENKPIDVLQVKQTLSKNQSELIYDSSQSKNKFSSAQPADRRDQLKRSMLIQFSRNKVQRAKEEPIISMPRKIDSETHINSNAVEKEVFPPPKRLSCVAYIIYEIPTQKQKLQKLSVELPKKRDYLKSSLHAGCNIKVASEIASLTKIMTCIVVIEVCERFAINAATQKYKTGTFECYVRGTTAELQPGDIYSIHELLHGLMLPSGNDASLALARWAGNILLLNDDTIRRTLTKTDSVKSEPYFWALQNKFLRSQGEKLRARRCYNRFIAQMNKRARLLGMERTTYANSHGLSNALNRSCCLDLAILCQHAMNNSYFRQIVACKEFTAQIDREITVSTQTKPKFARKMNSFDPEEMNLDADAEDRQTEDRSQCDDQGQEERVQLQRKEVQWTNTHRLLHEREEYIGIKTGVTVTAGPCLASCLRLKDRSFIIVVLNSKKLSHRFTDTEILRQWLARKEKLKCASRRVQEEAISSSEESN